MRKEAIVLVEHSRLYGRFIGYTIDGQRTLRHLFDVSEEAPDTLIEPKYTGTDSPVKLVDHLGRVLVAQIGNRASSLNQAADLYEDEANKVIIQTQALAEAEAKGLVITGWSESDLGPD